MIALFTALGLALVAGVHPNSISHTSIEVDGESLRIEIRCQALTLRETLPGLDTDGDGELSREELDTGRAAIAAYLRSRLEVRPGPGESDAPVVHLTLESMEAFEEEKDDLRDWIRIVLSASTPADMAALSIRNRCFLESNQKHADFARVAWRGEGPVSFLFAGEERSWLFEPTAVRRPGVLLSFGRLGMNHILSGWDHLTFLAVLIVAARSLRSLAWVVTAFTASHSLTLGLAAFDLVPLEARLVELAIALSIAYVAADVLLRRSPRGLGPEAFVFGLLHGLGFAGFLRDAMASEPLVISALVGFNLGVEAGQLAVILPLGLALAFFSRRNGLADGDLERGLAPAWLRMAACGTAVLLGLWWFIQRAFIA